MTGGNDSLATTEKYDLAGRLVEQVDAADLVTTYDYEFVQDGGLKTTVTRPGEMTEIAEYYRDGRIKSVAGTGVVHRYHSYGVDNTGGTQWTLVRTGAVESPRWTKTTYDVLG